MEEQKKEKEKPVTKEDVMPAQPDLMKQANEAAERLEKANKELRDLLDRRDLMKAEEILGGKSDAGHQTMTEDDKEVAEAKKMLAGTGFEDDLFPGK